MGLFGKSPTEKFIAKIDKLERQGKVDRNAYKTRKHCGDCQFFRSQGSVCRWHNKKTIVAEYCSSFQYK